MNESNPFLGVWVHPYYGRKEVAVRWSLEAKAAANAIVSVYRSLDGAAGWQLVSPDLGLKRADHFIDKGLVIQDRVSVPHYRLTAEIGDQVFESPKVGVFARLSRVEFGLWRQMIFAKFYEMKQRRAGERVLVYKPVHRGEPCSCQGRSLVSCRRCYGTGWVAGYYVPWVTYMQRNNVSAPEIEHTPEDGSWEHQSYEATFLGVPEIWQGDLIVQPATDERFDVEKLLKAASMRSQYPVTMRAQLRPIRKDSSRYLVPLPPVFDDVSSEL